MEIKPGMNLLDAALRSGSLEDLFSIAAINGLSITDDLQAGSVVYSSGKNYQKSSNVILPVRVSHSVVVLSGQTLLDLAIQEVGGLEAVFQLSLLNGLSITSTLAGGQQIQYSVKPVNKKILKAYKDNKWKPASGATMPGQQAPEVLSGVGYWAIGFDFIVS